MKELLSVCAVAAFIVYGYFIMDKLDAFLANNRRLAEAEIAENSLFIVFDNPMILDSLMPLFEKFSKANPKNDWQRHCLMPFSRSRRSELPKAPAVRSHTLPAPR